MHTTTHTPMTFKWETPWKDSTNQTLGPNYSALRLCCASTVPAVDDNGPSVWNAALGAIDLLQEPEDTTGLIGHPVIWPAQVLIVPDVPWPLLLWERYSKTKRAAVN